MNDNFYQKQYFDQLSQQITDLQKDVAEIKSKVIYMYGFAAAIGLVGSFFVDWIRTTVSGVPH